MPLIPPTPASLLDRLRRPSSKEAWSRFVALYTPLLHHWARRLGLEREEMTDFLQDFFVLLLRKLPGFRYDRARHFRGWLRKSFLNHWQMRGRKQQRTVRADGADDLDQLAAAEDAELEDAEHRRFVVARALDLMQTEFHEATWKACWEVVVNERPAAEVAAELGLTVTAVYVARSRVLRRLREELAGLMD